MSLLDRFRPKKIQEAVRRKRVAKPYAHRNSKGVTYYLHSTEVTLRGGKPQTIFFFRKDIGGRSSQPGGKEYQPAELPETHTVRENPRNGFLTITRKER